MAPPEKKHPVVNPLYFSPLEDPFGFNRGETRLHKEAEYWEGIEENLESPGAPPYPEDED